MVSEVATIYVKRKSYCLGGSYVGKIPKDQK